MEKTTYEINGYQYSNINLAIGTLGLLAGIAYAYKKGSGAGGYVGFALIGTILGNTIGLIVSPPKKI